MWYYIFFTSILYSIDPQKTGHQRNHWRKKEKSDILAISNKFKNILDELVDSINNSLDIRSSANWRQVDMPNNDIPGLGENASSLKETKDILKNESWKYHQHHITLFSLSRGDAQEKLEILKSKEEISEINVYYSIIYK